MVDVGFPDSEKGTTQYEKGVQTSAFGMARAASPAAVTGPPGCTAVPVVPPPWTVNPDMQPPSAALQLSYKALGLTQNEKSDNQRYETLICDAWGRGFGMMRVCWDWPLSFFVWDWPSSYFVSLTPPKLMHLTRHERINPPLPKGAQTRAAADFFEHGGVRSTKFGMQSDWFKIWDSAQLERPPFSTDFIYKRGDVIDWGQGHVSIVVGDNLPDQVMVSQMSRCRYFQAAGQRYSTSNPINKYIADFSSPPYDDNGYGITRNLLKELRSPPPQLIVFTGISTKPYRLYRLMPWIHNPDFYKKLSELLPEAHNAAYSQSAHTVANGETISGVAQAVSIPSHSVTVDALAAANGISNQDPIQPRDLLYIP